MTEAWIDHVVLAVPDVAAATALVSRAWGVEPTVGGAHDGRGTCNVLLALGGRTYLEIIGPDPDQPAPARPRAFGVDGLDPADPWGRLAGWAVGTGDIDGLVEAMRERGAAPGAVHPMARTRPDGVRLEWRLTLSDRPPRPCVPFLIDWGTTPSPAGDAARGCTLRSLSIAVAADAPELDALGEVTDLGVGRVDAEVDGLVAVVTTPVGEVTLTA